MASTGGRYSVITKGPLTGAIACSNSGGYFGAELKFAGWDMIIFEGESPKPVYLYIENDSRAARRRRTLGQDRLGDRAGDQDAAPGSADPRRCHRPRRRDRLLYAAIVNDLHRAAGRSGVGRGDGLQEPEGDRRARHEGRRQHPRTPRRS